jgi:hypothetical protein
MAAKHWTANHPILLSRQESKRQAEASAKQEEKKREKG